MILDNLLEFIHTVDPEPKVTPINFGVLIEYSNARDDVVTAVAFQTGAHKIVAINGELASNSKEQQ